MVTRKVFMEVGEDGVALLTINNPPVNSLANAVFNDLYRRFEEVCGRGDIKAIVITGANGKFSSGAEIRTFQRKQESESEPESMILPAVTLINNVIEGCQKPVVAAIEGFALGGGLELAMACHARIAAPQVRLGLPELQLGIIPGLGGTQRLPRLVGLQKAIDMLLTSKAIDAIEARESGLVDEVAEHATLLLVARRWALGMAENHCPWQISLHRTDKLGSRDEALRILNVARSHAKKKFRNVRYPFLCLDAIEGGLCEGGEAGTLMENKICKTLVTTMNARALMHIFFSRRSTLKVHGITNQGIQARRIRKAAIVGAGLMGSGIATALIVSNIPVLVKDVNASLVQEGISRIKENLDGLVAKGKITKLQSINSLALVKVTEDYPDFMNVDLVIESVLEDTSLKQKIFSELERVCSPHCILASNTSCIDISVLGANTHCPERVVGIHFFSPAHVMQLLEIVRTERTSLQVIVDLLALAKTLQKVPLVVKSSLGFVANRIFVPYLLTACLLADLGLDPYRIDSVVKNFGMPMGPFRVADFSGIKTLYHVSQLWHEKFPGRFHRSALIDLLVKDNRLGEVTRRGFYNYEEAHAELRTLELREYLEESRKHADLNSIGKHTMSVADDEIVEMIFFPVINEACRVLEENVASQPADLDIASVLGMGFPSYRGGIIFWADSLGMNYVLSRLRQWLSVYGNAYKPSPILERLAAARIPLGQFSIDSLSRL